MAKSYWCIYCMKEIVPQAENGGNIYIHERDIQHPNDFSQDDEIWEN